MSRHGKNIVMAATVLGAFLFSPPVLFAQMSQGEKDTIFIGGLKVQPSVTELAAKQGRSLELKRVVQSLDTQFINALNATRTFQLVERKRKGDIELEQAFAAVAVDPSDKSAARAGRMAGAKYAFLPQIDGFEDRSETEEYQAIGRSSMNRQIFLSAVVQVVDTTSGKLLPDSLSVQLTKTEAVDMAKRGGAVGSDRVLVELAREMASRLSQELVSLVRPARVLSVAGRQIMVNRGTEAGFGKGEMVEVYAAQDVKDEDSGELYRNEMPVGEGRIVRADRRQSFVMLDGEDLGVAKGCVVRVLRPDAPARKAPAAPETSAERGIETPGSGDRPLKW